MWVAGRRVASSSASRARPSAEPWPWQIRRIGLLHLPFHLVKVGSSCFLATPLAVSPFLARQFVVLVDRFRSHRAPVDSHFSVGNTHSVIAPQSSSFLSSQLMCLLVCKVCLGSFAGSCEDERVKGEGTDSQAGVGRRAARGARRGDRGELRGREGPCGAVGPLTPILRSPSSDVRDATRRKACASSPSTAHTDTVSDVEFRLASQDARKVPLTRRGRCARFVRVGVSASLNSSAKRR